MCRVFGIVKVKVPVIFVGTAGFSLRRDGRYTMLDLKNVAFQDG